MVSWCMANWSLTFFSISDLPPSNKKIMLRLIRARFYFYMISDNPNVSLGIVDFSLYTRGIALKDKYHKKRMDMFAYAPVPFNYVDTLAKTFINLQSRMTKPVHPRKHFQQCSSSSDCYCNEYKLYLKDRSLKIHFGINNLILDNLEYSEEVS